MGIEDVLGNDKKERKTIRSAASGCEETINATGVKYLDTFYFAEAATIGERPGLNFGEQYARFFQNLDKNRFTTRDIEKFAAKFNTMENMYMGTQYPERLFAGVFISAALNKAMNPGDEVDLRLNERLDFLLYGFKDGKAHVNLAGSHLAAYAERAKIEAVDVGDDAGWGASDIELNATKKGDDFMTHSFGKGSSKEGADDENDNIYNVEWIWDKSINLELGSAIEVAHEKNGVKVPLRNLLSYCTFVHERAPSMFPLEETLVKVLSEVIVHADMHNYAYVHHVGYNNPGIASVSTEAFCSVLEKCGLDVGANTLRLNKILSQNKTNKTS